MSARTDYSGMKKLLASAVLAVALIVPSAADAHSTKRAKRGGWVIPTYVVMCESGGRNVVNHNSIRPAGYYQITTSTWRAYGGRRYAPTAEKATKRQQGIVAKRVLRGQGPGAWACW